MMGGTVAYAAFLTFCAMLMVLAFRPAWREWRAPTDCLPLSITKSHTTHIDHLAEEFRQEITSNLFTSPEELALKFDMVPEHLAGMDWHAVSKPMISLQSLDLQNAVKCHTPLYVNGDLHSIGHDAFSGLFVSGKIFLGPHSAVREWVHADDAIVLDVACVALRRISSLVAIELKKKCCFERLNAPVVFFGPPDEMRMPHSEVMPLECDVGLLPGALWRTDGLYMIRGDCVLPRHCKFNGSLIVTGHLIVGAHTIVDGDIKARKGVSLGTGVQVTGSVISENEIKMFHGVKIAGLVISETSVLIGTGSVIGSLAVPSTISAETIIVESGVITHGTVWARDVGTVWSV